MKSFLIQQFFKNVGEVWAGSPHLRSKSFLRLVTIMSRRQRKVFCSSNFSKMLARCGRAAHIREANWILQSVFLLQSLFWKPTNSQLTDQWETSLQIRTRQRGDCSTLVGKSRGGTPFCRTLKTVFSKRSSPRKITRTLHKEFFPKKQFWSHFTIKSPSFSGKIG